MSIERFLIDANSLITPYKRFYPFDFAPGFWTQMEDHIQSGEIAILDLVKRDDELILSLKNTSKEMLNISAEELAERFVRGDRSRNTEGSGLGLSIARNLTELQGGRFEITVDGDLFKVDVAFPEAAAEISEPSETVQ